MGTATIILALSALVVSGAAAIAAILQANIAVRARNDAQAAQSASEKASGDAVRLAAIANEAFIRSAEAAEKLAALKEAEIPKSIPHWTIQQLNRSRYVVTNDGRATATGALVEGAGEAPGYIKAEESVRRDVEIGDSIEFFAMHVSGPNPRIKLSWTNPDGEFQEVERDIY
jgi:type II secretory pathway pseudopilin PulG